MRYCRYDDDRIGVVRDDKVHDVTAILDELPAQRYPFPRGDAVVSRLPELRGKMEKLADASEGQPISGVRLLSPVANPTKVIGTPVNYKPHVEEAKADDEITYQSAGPSKKNVEIGECIRGVKGVVGVNGFEDPFEVWKVASESE